MKRVTYLALAILILAGSTACRNNQGSFDTTGVFEATEILVSSEVNGRIMELNIQEGDRLEAGAYLGYVDSIHLHLQKMQLAAGLKAVDIRKPDIRKQIAALEQQIATARTEQQRMENLVNAKAGNQKQLDDIINNIKYLQKQLDAQYSTLNKTSGSTDAEAEGLQYQIMQLDNQLQKCRIVNPQTGTVLTKYAEPGEVTAAGKPLYKIADTDLLYLRAYITAGQLTQLKTGQSVRVFADYGEIEQREYPGTITWISDKSEFTPKGIQTKDERANLVYAIKIAVKNDRYLKIGQYGEVEFNPNHPLTP
ncbi:HlyD family secretion protein [Parabacteroides sp. PF5-5]|uniref:HlyD family secretion protein n=1 Tax=unclassified Parabacteroides TaxID=2649774 RepID=UPI0024746824|nr:MULTISPECIES: HlyD family efflux transporter periplasmic adaptor subunit [unclassified Parabacteroides]MDH6305848.1 HlyD family secretion protein [Parabacteroides sp. PH5-39]MDH6317338.1 HlyD family secretion protein [Parabacteroides sp. PF5-13]MDH6320546.1 HlyD family secretion protein [Parabacteroides sp. PH5-13]MDH6324291.1 HlyD family secretion protein [Parabacteroides sp. PH5-8]MDH6328488.1 HlyD family secretion protein [Parabacteroides sp. PH5-41]